MSAPTKPGYYWVRHDGSWHVGHFNGGGWVSMTNMVNFDSNLLDVDDADEWGPRVPSPEQLAVLTGPVRDVRDPPIRMVHRPCGTTLEDASYWEDQPDPAASYSDWYCRNCRVFSGDQETDLEHV